MPADTQIAIVNESTVVTDAEVQHVTNALQVQVHRDYLAAWGRDADLTFYPAGKTPPAPSWLIAILDVADVQGAGGYHDLTQAGLPLGKVFAKTNKDAGDAWSVAFSHELLEMLGDSDINQCVFLPHGNGGVLLAYENCDAVEADQYGYKIDDVLCSDFVYPSWFWTIPAPAGTTFDHMGHCTSQFQILPGGYIGVYEIGYGRGWTQLTAQRGCFTLHHPADFALALEDVAPYHARPQVGSRREKRQTPRHHWLRSTAPRP